MSHRHLNHGRFTLAAIDDIIARGRFDSWRALRRAMVADPSVRDKVLRVCLAHAKELEAQRYQFWAHYAAHQAAA